MEEHPKHVAPMFPQKSQCPEEQISDNMKRSKYDTKTTDVMDKILIIVSLEPMRMVTKLNRKSLGALEKSGHHNVPERNQEVSGVVHSARLFVKCQHFPWGTCRPQILTTVPNTSATNFTQSKSPCRLRRRNHQQRNCELVFHAMTLEPNAHVSNCHKVNRQKSLLQCSDGPRSYSHVCLLSHPFTVPSRPLQLLACPRHGDGALPYMANASSSLVLEMGFLTVEHSSGQQPFSRVFYAPPGATLWLHRSTPPSDRECTAMTGTTRRPARASMFLHVTRS